NTISYSYRIPSDWLGACIWQPLRTGGRHTGHRIEEVAMTVILVLAVFTLFIAIDLIRNPSIRIDRVPTEAPDVDSIPLLAPVARASASTTSPASSSAARPR